MGNFVKDRAKALKEVLDTIEKQFGTKRPEIADANVRVLKAGYHYGETVELLDHTYQVEPAKLPAGTYRNVMGNQAIAPGCVAASKLSRARISSPRTGR